MALAPTSHAAAPFARPLLVLFTLIVAFALLGLGSRQAQATIYYVATTGSGFNSGLSWSSPKSDLQATITAAHSGDQVWVAKGTYTNASNFTATDGVAVYGGFAGTETSIGQRDIAANPSVLNYNSGSNSVLVYAIPNSATGTNTVDGFIVENGAGGFSDASNDTLNIANCTFTNNSGGGVYVAGATTTIRDCMFTNNSTFFNGGGVYAAGATTTISDCTFTNNSIPYNVGGGGVGGGGVYAAGATTTISDCTFTNNSVTAGAGGGIFAHGATATISGCTFTNNSASQDGGGIYAQRTTTTIIGCTFANNSSIDGGGVEAFDSEITISGCTLTNNSASHGGGVYANGAITVSDCTFEGLSATDANTPDAISLYSVGNTSTTPPTPAVVKDCLIVGSGAATTDPDGIDIDMGQSVDVSYATIDNNTIVNTNVGIDIDTRSGAISVANNIFSGDYGALDDPGSATFTSSHNDTYGNVSYDYHGRNPSASDLAVNPEFADAAASNYHLASNSPLIGAGDVGYVSPGDTDLDGNPREVNGKVDIGCYETSATAMATLTSISPATIQAGANAFTITATGTGFVSGGALKWNGTALATTYASATRLTATVPASLVATAGTASVTEVNPGTAASNALTFTVTAASGKPTITSFTPTSGPIGTSVTITGTNLTGATVVGFQNAHATSFTVNAAGTQITTTVPVGAATGTIAVLTPGGEAKSAASFTVTAAMGKPTITGFTPASGPVGTTVTITGTNLTGATVVGFQNQHAASSTVNGAGTQITTTVPAGAATGPIAVATPSGTAKSATSFTVTAAMGKPTITGFSPASGPVGTTVTITGTNLTGTTVVGFTNAHAMSFTVNAAGTQITTTVPSGAATGTIAVLTPGGEAKSASSFTVTAAAPKPTITGFSPASGPVGTTVVITGTNLTGATVVGFTNAHAASFTVNGTGTQITTTVPSGAATGPIAVLTPGGEAKSSASFTVTP